MTAVLLQFEALEFAQRPENWEAFKKQLTSKGMGFLTQNPLFTPAVLDEVKGHLARDTAPEAVRFLAGLVQQMQSEKAQKKATEN